MAWPLVAVLCVGAILRIVLTARNGGGAWSVIAALVAVIVLLGGFGWVAEYAYRKARGRAHSTGLPLVMPVIIPRKDLAGLGGWIGGFRNASPAAGYVATDGHRLQYFPVRLSRFRHGAQPISVDLDSVTGTEPGQLQMGVRKVSAVVLQFGEKDGPPLRLTLGCSNWDKADVAHSPLARFVKLPDDQGAAAGHSVSA